MSNGDRERIAYRAWAATQVDLPIYWQPQWLDLVAEGRWRAALYPDDGGRVAVAWPYCLQTRGPLRWLAKPPFTRYCGPRFDGVPAAALDLPAGLSYGSFTVVQPEAAWHFGASCRAMATQVVDLRERPPYDTAMRRRLRKAGRELTVAAITHPEGLTQAGEILAARPECGGLADLALISAAAERGFGLLLGAFRDADGRLEGFIGSVFDAQRAYMPLLARRPGASSGTTARLIDEALGMAADRNLWEFDLHSGFFPGIRHFHHRMGGRPRWYGQVRLARTRLWRGIELVQSLRNTRRL